MGTGQKLSGNQTKTDNDGTKTDNFRTLFVRYFLKILFSL